MNVSGQDLSLSECVREFPCQYDKTIPEYHQRDVTANWWEEVAKKAGLENRKSFVFMSSLKHRLNKR